MFTVQFLLENIPLTWTDILWGYEKQFFGWRVPIEFASAQLKTTPSFDALEFELAGIQKDQDWKVRKLLEELSKQESIPEFVSQEKWIYLTLLRLYENQGPIEDTLRSIEEVYADFCYPGEITSFVNFVGPQDDWDPRVNTLLENQNRMLMHWKNYLDRTRLRFT